MTVYYSHLTYVEIPTNSNAQVLFPGCKHVPTGSLGYVRSDSLISKSWKYRSGLLKADDKCPFRDYPDEIRTKIDDLVHFFLQEFEYVLLISARNVLNEWCCQARIDGKWWRRHGDPDIDPNYPVLRITKSGRFLVGPLGDTSNENPLEADILTGVPVVINGKAMDRAFLIANSSDVTHSYECQPKGYFGPRPPAWLEISNAWQNQWEKSQNNPLLFEEKRVKKIDAVASKVTNRHGGEWPSGSYKEGPALPHSLIVEFKNKKRQTNLLIYAMVITGSLWDIAEFLVNIDAKNAFVLDQSGSVCYYYIHKKENSLKLKPLVSTTNYRASGTCFLAVETKGFETTGFMRPTKHFCLTNFAT